MVRSDPRPMSFSGVASHSRVQRFSSVDEGFPEGPAMDGAAHQHVKVSKGNGKSSVPQPLVVRLSPDERVAEARARVLRLEAALQVLGEQAGLDWEAQ